MYISKSIYIIAIKLIWFDGKEENQIISSMEQVAADDGNLHHVQISPAILFYWVNISTKKIPEMLKGEIFSSYTDQLKCFCMEG